MRPSVLMLTPEPPYPLRGGGAYRIASLVHYFAQFADVDLILISEGGRPALLPAGLVRSQTVIGLPRHGKGTTTRYLRNARRAVLGIPPLIDRLAGLERELLARLQGRHYSLGIVEHFWCAPYASVIEKVCARTVLDLHNVESVLHERCASVSRGFIAAGHRRFACRSKMLETEWLPRFSLVLTASGKDADTVSSIAPGTRLLVYPNAIPWVDTPQRQSCSGLVFSGNFEYHPNIDAVAFLATEIWPRLKSQHPELTLKLVGRGEEHVRRLIAAKSDIETTGAVDSALDEIASGAIVIAPLRTGSGTRIKILEAWAAAKPVVATSLAAEGLRAIDGQNILLADRADEFARAVSRVLADERLRERLATGGRATFEANYTWNAAWESLSLNPQLTLFTELNRYTG